MRFTKAQVALFKGGISFVHMSPTETRRYKALYDFKTALSGYYTGTMTMDGMYDGTGKTFAKFMVCRLAGASTNHVPVIFMDGMKSEFPQPKAYDDARYIPAEVDGCGPMVVR